MTRTFLIWAPATASIPPMYTISMQTPWKICRRRELMDSVVWVSSALEQSCSYKKSTLSSVHNYCRISFGNDWLLSALIAPPLEKVSVSPGRYCSQSVRDCLGVILFCQLTFKYNNVSLLTRTFHLLKSLVLVWHDLPFKTFIWFFPTLWSHNNCIVLIFEVTHKADSLFSPHLQAWY